MSSERDVPLLCRSFQLGKKEMNSYSGLILFFEDRTPLHKQRSLLFPYNLYKTPYHTTMSSRSRFADVMQRGTSRLLAFAAFGFIGYTSALILGNKVIFPVERKKVVSFHESDRTLRHSKITNNYLGPLDRTCTHWR